MVKLALGRAKNRIRDEVRDSEAGADLLDLSGASMGGSYQGADIFADMYEEAGLPRPLAELSGSLADNRLSPLPMPPGTFDWMEPRGDDGRIVDPHNKELNMTDCDRWPQSPFCRGEGVLGHTPLGLGLEVFEDGCNIVIQYYYEIAWTRIPFHSVGYRRPECRIEDDDEEDADPPTPGSGGRGGDYAGPPPPQEKPTQIEYATWKTQLTTFTGVRYIDHPQTSTSASMRGWVGNVSTDTSAGGGMPHYPWMDRQPTQSPMSWALANPEKIPPDWKVTYSANWIANSFLGTKYPTQSRYNKMEFTRTVYGGEAGGQSRSVFTESFTLYKFVAFSAPTWLALQDRSLILTASTGLRTSEDYRYVTTSGDPGGHIVESDWARFQYAWKLVWYTGAPAATPSKRKKRRSHPPRRIGGKPVDCCAALEDKLNLLIRRTGVNRFPIDATAHTSDEDEEKIEIDNMTDLIAWGSQNVLETLGEFPIKLKIITDEGEESEDVSFPNLAELLAEMYGLLFGSALDSDNSYAVGIAQLGLSAQIFATMLSTYDLTFANSAYLGYRITPKERKIEIPFTPGLNPGTTKIDDLLTPSQQEVRGWQMDDESSLYGILEKMMFGISVIRESVFTSAKPDEVVARMNELRNRIRRLAGEQEESEGEVKKWDEFLLKEGERLNQYLKARGLPEIEFKEIRPPKKKEGDEK